MGAVLLLLLLLLRLLLVLRAAAKAGALPGDPRHARAVQSARAARGREVGCATGASSSSTSACSPALPSSSVTL